MYGLLYNIVFDIQELPTLFRAVLSVYQACKEDYPLN